LGKKQGGLMEALVAIDVQNDFSPEGALAVESHAAALEEIAGRVASAREAGQPVARIVQTVRPAGSASARGAGAPSYRRGSS
jgi:nicotinamidase-related amidase